MPLETCPKCNKPKLIKQPGSRLYTNTGKFCGTIHRMQCLNDECKYLSDEIHTKPERKNRNTMKINFNVNRTQLIIAILCWTFAILLYIRLCSAIIAALMPMKTWIIIAFILVASAFLRGMIRGMVKSIKGKKRINPASIKLPSIGIPPVVMDPKLAEKALRYATGYKFLDTDVITHYPPEMHLSCIIITSYPYCTEKVGGDVYFAHMTIVLNGKKVVGIDLHERRAEDKVDEVRPMAISNILHVLATLKAAGFETESSVTYKDITNNAG